MGCTDACLTFHDGPLVVTRLCDDKALDSFFDCMPGLS